MKKEKRSDLQVIIEGRAIGANKRDDEPSQLKVTPNADKKFVHLEIGDAHIRVNRELLRHALRATDFDEDDEDY